MTKHRFKFEAKQETQSGIHVHAKWNADEIHALQSLVWASDLENRETICHLLHAFEAHAEPGNYGFNSYEKEIIKLHPSVTLQEINGDCLLKVFWSPI